MSQSAPIIAVDPKSRDDEHYRYKMPGMLTKIEGNGNGIKTVFPNIADVCNSIHRAELFLLKFLGQELGAQSTELKHQNDLKYLVMGPFKTNRIQDKVDQFITKYVLCEHCRNPETEVKVEKQRATLVCKACQKVTKLSSADKMLNVINTHPTHGNKTDKKGATAEKRPDHSGPTTVVDATAVAATPVAAPAAEQKQSLGTEAFEKVLEALKKDDANGVIEQRILEMKFQLSDEDVIKAILYAVDEFARKNKEKPKMFFAALIPRIPLLRKFCDTREHQDAVIKYLEKCRFCDTPETAYKFPVALKLLYDETILTDIAITQWHSNTKVPKKEEEQRRLAAFKEKCTPLISWLNDQPVA